MTDIPDSYFREICSDNQYFDKDIILVNATKMQMNANGIIQCYPYGVSNKNREISFMLGERNSSVNSTIAAANGISEKMVGKVKVLDDILVNEEVTFVKMDIEGAEWDALDGARKLIRSCLRRFVMLSHKSCMIL